MSPDKLPHIVLFPASLRRESYQRRLVDYFADQLGSVCTIDIIRAGDVDLPLFNQDLESNAPVLAAVKQLHGRFSAADGFIIASPEYNGHVSPYLKNTVDWISRLPRIDPAYRHLNAFSGRPALLASASNGWTGGVLGLRDARTIFSYLGCVVVPEQICVSDVDQWLIDGKLRLEQGFADYIVGVLTGFVALTTKIRRASSRAH